MRPTKPEFNEIIASIMAGEDARSTLTEFNKKFGSEIQEFTVLMTTTFDHLTSAIPMYESSGDEGTYLAAILWGAFSTHLTSMRLLVEGHLVQSGNAERYVLESLALSILASRRESHVLKRFIAGQYSANKAIRQLVRDSSKHKVNLEAIQTLRDMASFYDNYSHPSMTALLTFFDPMKNQKLKTIIGSGYNHSQESSYEKEIHFRLDLASTFPQIIEGISNEYFISD